MNLGDIINDLPEDPEEQKRKHQLSEELNALRERFTSARSRVSDAEMLEGIRNQFETR